MSTVHIIDFIYTNPLRFSNKNSELSIQVSVFVFTSSSVKQQYNVILPFGQNYVCVYGSVCTYIYVIYVLVMDTTYKVLKANVERQIKLGLNSVDEPAPTICKNVLMNRLSKLSALHSKIT